MKPKYFAPISRTLTVFFLLTLMFSIAPRSFAQSSQDWSEPINLSNSGAASNPSMVVDSNGMLHVLWIDSFDGYKYTESLDNGVTWSAPVTVRFPFLIRTRDETPPPPPVFIPGAEGVIHIFWLGDKNKLSYAQALGKDLGSPSAWRYTTDLDSYVYDFDASLDSQGSLHVGYIKIPAPAAGVTATAATAGAAGAFYRQSANGGPSWSASVPLYESPYLRSTSPEDAHIRIASDAENVYAVWDDRSQKRIFMSSSADGGSNWEVAREVIVPQLSLGYRSPYNANIDLLKNEILVTWQVGEAGVRCTPYSWISNDRGKSWAEPVKILAESTECPEESEFIPIDPSYSAYLFTIRNYLTLSAWDGSAWSNPEIQTGPSAITNPTTFDSVSLGCEHVQAHNNSLFIVGCDTGPGGDIWVIDRKLESLAGLFPSPSAWSGETDVTKVTQSITSLTSIADDSNNLHLFWIQAGSSPTATLDPKIEYSRWNGKEWTKPASIITNLAGMPLNLSVQLDSNRRLLLSWVDQPTGELMFTWTNSERANIPPEWKQPVVLIASSKLTNSPDMLVDASGRIAIAYAITLNEERGIYLIQSTDLGETWSAPVRVFDAVAANIEMVDKPKLAVTEDGKLHVLFTKYSLLGGQQPTALFYSQSADGGTTWTKPEIVNEQPVQWSEILAFKEVLHRVWQEKNKSVISTYHQYSSDAGLTWSPAARIPGDTSIISEPALSMDWTGRVHFLQLLQEDNQILQEWGWADENWQLLDTKRLSLQEQIYPLPLEAGITSQGGFLAILQSEELLPDKTIGTDLLNIRRSLEIKEKAEPILSSISTPAVLSLPTQTPEVEPLSTPKPPLEDLSDAPSWINKNVLGMVLVVFLVLLILFFTIPKRSSSANKTKKTK